MRAHRRAVVEDQAVAEREAPGQPVVGDLVAGGHLRAGGAGAVLAVQRVPDHEPVVAAGGGGGPDRVGALQAALGDEAEHAEVALGDRRTGQRRRGAGGQDGPAVQMGFSVGGGDYTGWKRGHIAR